MPRQLELEILPQPDDTSCGPTCLHAVYRFYDDELPLQQVIGETPRLDEGGTLAVLFPKVRNTCRHEDSMTTQLVLTCEHAGNRVPAAYKLLFRHARQALQSHRGWDLGSLEMASTFQQRLAAPLFYSSVTRLLVEPNRSVGNRHLFSEFTAGLDEQGRRMILDRYYHPHRDRVESWIDKEVARGHRVIHLSIHSFTPRLNGQTRKADIGLLYDPRRLRERTFCDKWSVSIKSLRPDLVVRRNYPYLGKADGFTTHLRRRFPEDRYVGIELEVNQLWPALGDVDWRRLRRELTQTFATAWR